MAIICSSYYKVFLTPLKKRANKTGQCAGRIRMYQSQRYVTHFPGVATRRLASFNCYCLSGKFDCWCKENLIIVVSVLFFLKILAGLVYPFQSIQQTKGMTPARGYNGSPLVDWANCGGICKKIMHFPTGWRNQ